MSIFPPPENSYSSTETLSGSWLLSGQLVLRPIELWTLGQLTTVLSIAESLPHPAVVPGGQEEH